MSDLGNEVATSALRISKELLELINNLIKLAIRNSANKANLNSIENDKFASGRINMKKLKESGSKIIPLKTELSKEQMRMFDKYAKQYGVAYSALTISKYKDEIINIKKELKELEKEAKAPGLLKEQVERRNELNVRLEELEKIKENKIIFIKDKDIELIADITNRMNEEIILNDAKKEKDLYDEKQKSEELNPDEKNRYDELNEINNEYSNDVIIEDTDFIHALNDASAKAISRNYKDTDNSMIVCDMMHPENYIKVSAKEEVAADGNTYTATYYNVYKNDVAQKCDEFSHGKFRRDTNNRGDNTSKYGKIHWENIQDEMRKKSDIGERIAIFSNESDFAKYKESVIKERNELINKEKEQGNYKNYNDKIDELKEELNKFNKDDIESVNISKQINEYQELNILQTELAIVRTKIEDNEEEYKKTEDNRSADDITKYNSSKEILSSQEAELVKSIEEKQMVVAQLQDERNYNKNKNIIEKQNHEKDNRFTHGEEMESETREFTHGEEMKNEYNQSMEEWQNDVKDNQKIEQGKEVGNNMMVEEKILSN